MYSPSDPRSKLASAGGGTASTQASPYGAQVSADAFAAAEYVKFYETRPADTSATSRTWYGRGQNFIVAYTETTGPAELSREAQPDEYFLLLPEADTVAHIKTPNESVEVKGNSIVIMPPGPGTVSVSGGRVVRVFTTRNEDLVAKCSNAAAYEKPHPRIPPFQPWPDPPGGFRVRAYSLDVPPQEGRFGRIWRCTTLMINVIPPEPPRDVTRLSPHHHEDFEQCSLALEGAFVHHLRWPWVANQHHWREDEHVHCPAPSMAVIPPPAIHTSAATDPRGNQLVDIFSPPRMDFSKMPGWVLNADEYPLP
jgi:hypothetical protein